ncbi:MAG TPA: ABC transporter permease, partial [Thermoleophilia bacterium]|nr:ABC transporter permease [Thermoleophilia bacterium]
MMLEGATALLRRELKGQVRGRRAPATLTAYLALMVIVLGGVLLVSETVAGSGTTADSGQVLFIALAMTQTALILLLGPVFSAGALAGERERRTFDTLVCSRLTSGGIIVGKVAGALVFQLLLATSSLPLMALAYVYGGVGPGTLFAVYGWDILLMVWVASLGTAVSSLVRRTLWAAVITYVLVFLSVFMTGFLEIVVQAVLADSGRSQPSFYFIYLNPFAGLWELVIPGAREGLANGENVGSFVVWGGVWHAGVI